MVNISMDSEKIMKHLITQFCDQQFKFTLNLKILGSIHVIVDNNEVLNCFLDEKFYKPNVGNGLIMPNNSFNPASHLAIPHAEHALNLVNTLNQLQQQQRCVSKMSVSTASNGKSSKSSSSSHSSSSSASSSSSYISSVLSSNDNTTNQEPLQQASKHKRKRFTPKSGKSDDAASTGSSKKDSENMTDNESDDEPPLSMNNDNSVSAPLSLSSNLQRMTTNDVQDEMDDQPLNAFNSESQTPGKRNKLDNEYDAQVGSVNSNVSNPSSEAEQAAAAAATLSLISIASRLSNPHVNTLATVHEPINQNLETNQTQLPQQQPQSVVKNKKSKIKSIIEEYTKNEQFQLQLQQEEQARNTVADTINAIASGADDGHYNNCEQNNAVSDSNNHNESSSSENQMYIDEGNDQDGPSSSTVASSSVQQQQFQQQHHQLMMAAAAAIINNSTGANNPNGSSEANKLFMPHLALNFPKQQPNVQIPKKKKQRQNSMMSPSSSTSTCSGTSTSQTSKSISSASSTTSTTSSKSGKKGRQTVAALAAAAAQELPAQTQQPLSTTQGDLQRNIVALAQQFAMKESCNFDQVIQDMNSNSEKSKLFLTHTPQPTGLKLSKKAHLLASRSANNTPNVTTTKGQRIKTKKSQFQDTSNLPSGQGMTPSNSVAQAAAAAAYRYQQLLSQVNNSNPGSNQGTPQKPFISKYGIASMYGGNYYSGEKQEYENHEGNHDNEDVENEETENCEDKESQNMYALPMGTAGSINFKSLNNANLKQEPLNNMYNQSNMNPMGPNLEFECTVCDKKFKYYCYYKRHMDACHSDNPKYVCDTCNKSYKWEASFRQHLRSHHIDGIKDETKDDAMDNQHMNGGNSGDKPDMYQNLKMSFQNNENRGVEYDDGEYKPGVDSDCEDNEYVEDYETEQREEMGGHGGGILVRDTEQMGAAGALASIADSINSMIQTQTQ